MLLDVTHQKKVRSFWPENEDKMGNKQENTGPGVTSRKKILRYNVKAQA